MYNIEDIQRIVGGRLQSFAADEDCLRNPIEHLVYDTRRIQQPATSVFFALKSQGGDGHAYLRNAFKQGVCLFVVQKAENIDGAVMLEVPDVLAALQTLAGFHRRQFQYPTIGITGSNGKTIVKEWLYHLLEDQFEIVRSPRSYNSQIGVPLSVWEMRTGHNLAIIEAGISAKGEMEALARIIQPQIGIITSLGEAHSEGFVSVEEKLEEKLKLFENAQVVIGPYHLLNNFQGQTITWGKQPGAGVQLVSVESHKNFSKICLRVKQSDYSFQIPFTDDASVANAITCFCVLFYLNLHKNLLSAFANLHAIDMRLQLMQGINNCVIINDSYSADLTSFRIALDFLIQQSPGLKRTLILSDFVESGKEDFELYHEVAQLVNKHQVQRLMAVGTVIGRMLPPLLKSSTEVQLFQGTNDLLSNFQSSGFYKEAILLKGARKFNFENIARLFQQKLHGTVLQINLTALSNNVKAYRKVLSPQTKIMAMVKAFSYGSGGPEIASVLQFNNVDYLGVAYADEGAGLIKSGITLPVMVMNTEKESFSLIIENGLQPVIFSMELLNGFENFIKDQGLTNYPVHIEVDTGMNRLGFKPAEVSELPDRLVEGGFLKLQSVFTHLVAGEDPASDDFTKQQADIFSGMVSTLQTRLPYQFLKHIANSAGALRHNWLEGDMVRIGIGLYGIEPIQHMPVRLEPVATLRSTVAQVHKLSATETVSYNRKGVLKTDSLVATVRIGYADGYSRRFSNGVGSMLVNGKRCPVIGNVCMDMTMIDVTAAGAVKEGDDVIVFGPQLPVQEIAGWIDSIPYEIMTAVSQRVKRVYYYE